MYKDKKTTAMIELLLSRSLLPSFRIFNTTDGWSGKMLAYMYEHLGHSSQTWKNQFHDNGGLHITADDNFTIISMACKNYELQGACNLACTCICEHLPHW